MNFFDYFQIAAVALALSFTGFKAGYLRLARKTSAIVIGRRRTGFGSLVSTGLLIDALALFNFGDSWRVGIDEENAGALPD